MASKFHISPGTGTPAPCTASVRECPVGGSDEHYPSASQARQAFEASMLEDAMPQALKKAVANDPSLQARVKAIQLAHTMTKPSPAVEDAMAKERLFLAFSEDHPRAVNHPAFAGLAAAYEANTSNPGWHETVAAKIRQRNADALSSSEFKTSAEVMNYEIESLLAERGVALNDAGQIDRSVSVTAPKPSEKKPFTPPKGYSPEVSELDVYRDLYRPKEATVGRLRHLNNEDLGKAYVQFKEQTYMSSRMSEITPSENAMARVEKVVAERGMKLVENPPTDRHRNGEWSPVEAHQVLPA